MMDYERLVSLTRFDHANLLSYNPSPITYLELSLIIYVSYLRFVHDVYEFEVDSFSKQKIIVSYFQTEMSNKIFKFQIQLEIY